MTVISALLACTDPSTIDHLGTTQHEMPVPPEGYSAMYVQVADGSSDPLDPEQNPAAADVYAEHIGDDFEAWREEGYLWIAETFGLDIFDPSMEGRLVTYEAALSPGARYRVVSSTAEEIPEEGLPIIDIGLSVTVVDPLGMELGGEWEGTFAPPGTGAAYGLYIFDRGEEKVVAPFRSRGPMNSSAIGVSSLECIVEHPELGVGSATVFSEIAQSEQGLFDYDIRTVVLFE